MSSVELSGPLPGGLLKVGDDGIFERLLQPGQRARAVRDVGFLTRSPTFLPSSQDYDRVSRLCVHCRSPTQRLSSNRGLDDVVGIYDYGGKFGIGERLPLHGGRQELRGHRR